MNLLLLQPLQDTTSYVCDCPPMTPVKSAVRPGYHCAKQRCPFVGMKTQGDDWQHGKDFRIHDLVMLVGMFPCFSGCCRLECCAGGCACDTASTQHVLRSSLGFLFLNVRLGVLYLLNNVLSWLEFLTCYFFSPCGILPHCKCPDGDYNTL